VCNASDLSGPAIAPRSVEVLLFDLGGVVIDFDFGRCLGRWAESAGCAIPDIASRFSFDSDYEDHERGLLDAAGYFASLRRGLAVELSDEELLEGWLDIFVGPLAGMAPLLAAASARFPLYAFTNSNRSHQAVWSERFAEELAVFTATFVSSDLGFRKPDPEAFEAVVARIGVPSSSILFFDDRQENVVGALEAGLQAVHVTSIDSVRSALSPLGVDRRPGDPARTLRNVFQSDAPPSLLARPPHRPDLACPLITMDDDGQSTTAPPAKDVALAQASAGKRDGTAPLRIGPPAPAEPWDPDAEAETATGGTEGGPVC
jgi:putative hydrolase of the HAD superfamily